MIKLAPSGDTIGAISRTGEIEVFPLYTEWKELAAVGRGAVVRCLTGGERRSMNLANQAPAWCAALTGGQSDAQIGASEITLSSDPDLSDIDRAFVRRWPRFASDRSKVASSTSMDPARLLRIMLRDTERLWSEQFAGLGLSYHQPTLVLFTYVTHSACGIMLDRMVLSYCRDDGKIYVDPDATLAFLKARSSNGDASLAYVLGREVGRHVLAQLTAAFKDKDQGADRQEAFAECAAGVMLSKLWLFGRVEDGEMAVAFSAAEQLGADSLKASGSAIPATFSYLGSDARRYHLLQGLKSSAIKTCI
jgi:predicted metalloprotease